MTKRSCLPLVQAFLYYGYEVVYNSFVVFHSQRIQLDLGTP